MPLIGNAEKPVTFRQKTVVSKESQMRKGFDKKAYDDNWERIFGNKSELEIARETSKTFSMEQS